MKLFSSTDFLQWFFVILLSLCCFISKGQGTIQIKGYVSDTLGHRISRATIAVTARDDGSIICYGSSDGDGVYVVAVPRGRDTVDISATYLGYRKATALIIGLNRLNSIVTNFILKPNALVLEEVRVTAPVPKISLQKDTISFKADSFRNKNERITEDLLRRIPGVDVSRGGQITVNGQSIKTILIEGDNMFDSNYTLLSRNMSADVIDKVQIIDRYTENPLLKGIANSTDKVINITLKKERKRILFGDFDAAAGNDGRHEVNINAISFYKKTKAFAFLNSNTIGRDPLPMIINGQSAIDNFNQQDRASDNVLNLTGITKPQALTDDQTNFNRSRLASVTFLSRLNSKISAKGLLYVIGDKNRFNRFSNQYYVLDNSTIHYSENNVTYQYPLRANAYLTLTYQPTSNLLAVYAFNSRYNRNQAQGTTSSDSNRFTNALLDKTTTFSHRLDITQRFSESKAWSFAGSLFSAEQSQQLTVGQETPRLVPLTTDFTKNLQQFVSYPLKMGNAVARYLSGTDQNNVVIEGGMRIKQSRLLSNLAIDTGHSGSPDVGLPNPFQNDAKLDRISYFVSGSAIKSIGESLKIAGKADATIQSIDFAPSRTAPISKNYLIIAPRIGISWKRGYNGLSALVGYNTTLQEITSLFDGYTLVDYRTLKANSAALSNVKSLTNTLSYNYNDVLNGFTGFATFVYLKTTGGFITEAQLTNTFDVITRSNIESDVANYIYAVGVNKFLPALSSTLKLRENITSTTSVYQANGMIYHNKFTSSVSDISIKTAFKGILNFEVGTAYTWYNSKSAELVNSLQAANNFTSFLNLYMNLSPSFSMQATYEQYNFASRQTQNSQNSFLNLKCQYEVIKSKLTLALTGKNLLNSNSYTNVTISTYSKQVEQYQLLGRYLLVDVSYKF